MNDYDWGKTVARECINIGQMRKLVQRDTEAHPDKCPSDFVLGFVDYFRDKHPSTRYKLEDMFVKRMEALNKPIGKA